MDKTVGTDSILYTIQFVFLLELIRVLVFPTISLVNFPFFYEEFSVSTLPTTLNPSNTGTVFPMNK